MDRCTETPLCPPRMRQRPEPTVSAQAQQRADNNRADAHPGLVAEVLQAALLHVQARLRHQGRHFLCGRLRLRGHPPTGIYKFDQSCTAFLRIQCTPACGTPSSRSYAVRNSCPNGEPGRTLTCWRAAGTLHCWRWRRLWTFRSLWRRSSAALACQLAWQAPGRARAAEEQEAACRRGRRTASFWQVDVPGLGT